MDEKKLLKRKKKAANEHNKSLLINVCTDLANLYVEEGRYECAIEEFTALANVYKQQNKLIDYALANRAIGEAYIGLHKFDQAISHQRLYLEISRQLNNKLEEQRALATMGHTFLTSYLDIADNEDKNNLNLAYKYFMKSLSVCETLNGEVSKLECADMKARLCSNLGLVQDCLGNYDKALELINKSINICKVNDIYEQLQRGYMSLASLYEKKFEYNSAIQQYNLAIDTSKKLRDKPSMMGSALSAKADLLVKLGDLQGAKSALVKAYKLKITNIEERTLIERNLKIIAAMNKAEDKVLTTKDTDYPQLKKLYEQLGDGACSLKSYDRAIEYYKKMLHAAEQASMSNKDIATCYYSLGETYKDNGQYDEAVKYYEMELKLCQNMFNDSLNTLSRIADTKEMAGCSIKDVRDVYNKAIQYCKKDGDRHEEGRMLKRCILYLKRQGKHSDAFHLEKELTELDYVSSESETESEIEPSPNIGDDICLDDLTDLSDSDTDQPTKKRRRNRNFVIKRNVKGETQLHTACINGKLNVVRHLLDQGHPVNVRDHCGWLPLHEACICGHLEIVALLLERGAAINDRGGTHCNGVTPLYDAACNGHLDVVQFLLTNGASAIVKTDNGETVLDILEKWRAENRLDEDRDEELYDSIYKQLSNALEKIGSTTSNTNTCRVDKNKESPSSSTYSCNRENLRRMCDLDEPSTSWDDNFSHSSANDYRNVIEALRHKPQKSPQNKSPKNKRSALLNEDDVIDDWLEDDIGLNSRKRKTFDSTKHKSSQTLKSQKKTLSDTPSERMSEISYGDDELPLEIPDANFESNEEFLDVKYEELIPARTPSPYLYTYKQTSQTTLTDVGVLRNTTSGNPPSITNSVNSRNKGQHQVNSEVGVLRNTTPGRGVLSLTNTMNLRKTRKHQAKLTSFGHTRSFIEADSTSTSASVNTSNRRNSDSVPVQIVQPVEHVTLDTTLSVDVKIMNQLYRIPVLLSQINTHTIGWLAEEAAARYAKKEYIKPSLELQTTNGAILANDDLVGLLFPLGTLQSEQIEGKIIKWNLSSLLDRYREACREFHCTPNETIVRKLEQSSINLDLANLGLHKTLLPFCKALNREANLTELDLSGNLINNDCIQIFSSSLASLKHLMTLNLNCTGLKVEHLRMMVDSLSNLDNLTYLDVSDNFLGDQSFDSLSKITENLKLKYLNLSSNNLTSEILNNFSDHRLFLKYLEEFDLSDNQLNNDVLIKFISWLKPSMKCLNVSRNSTSIGLLGRILNVIEKNPNDCLNFEVMKVSRCHVQDSELFDLLMISEKLEFLDLSYNDDLSSTSLKRLLQNITLKELNLCGCVNILKNFEGCSIMNISNMKISYNSLDDKDNSNRLINIWKESHGNRSLIETFSSFLCLSTNIS